MLAVGGLVQVLGSIFGALIYTSLIPALHIGGGAGSPGCFGPAPGVTAGGVFGWELCMTFLLVMTVYASAVAKPGHGNTAPLAIGLSLYASAISGGCNCGRRPTCSRTPVLSGTPNSGLETWVQDNPKRLLNAQVCIHHHMSFFLLVRDFCPQVDPTPAPA